MEISYFFESLRTDFLDKLFLIITEFGGETITYLFLFIVVWCMDCNFSRYFVIANIYSLGTNILLKNIFCIPRPWIIDPNFTVVDGAVEAATGYSFPSGHTATAVSVYGSFITWFKNKFVRVSLSILIILVSLSRIYLGVHTIWDVLASIIVGVIIFSCIKLYLKHSKANDKYLVLIIVACLYSLMIVVILNFLPLISEYSSEQILDGLKNAYTIFGLSIGYLVSYIINLRYKTEASFIIQFFKVLFGAVFVLLIKEGSKYIFNLFLPNMLFTSAIRYFLIVVFAANVWPLSFKWFYKFELKLRSLNNAKS